MSNIFNFRPGKKETPNSDFLKDADDTVEFIHTGSDVRIGDAPQHFLNPETPLRDWSNQELANIYRVKKLLDAAGVPNELDRGISDEGDPWCIFCAQSGEVFIHLSRIDEGYVLDSPNLRAPIFGADFAELIEEFSAGALGSIPAATKANRRVVKLHRNGKVFLHPSALLAALVWSIYLNSEDLVMFAPEDDALTGSAGEDAVNMVNELALEPVATGDATAASFLNTTVVPDQMIPTRLSDAPAARDGAVLKDISGKMALVAAHTPIAVGLSSIAIAFGIMSEGFFDADTPETTVVADAALEVSDIEIAPAEREQEAAPRTPQFDLIAVLQSAFAQTQTPEDIVQSALSIEIAAGIDLSAILASVLPAPSQTDLPLDLKTAFQQSWTDEGVQEAVFFAEAREKQQTKTAEAANKEGPEATPVKQQAETVAEASPLVLSTSTTAAPVNEDPIINLASLTAFKAHTSSVFQTFDFGGTTIEATFDIATLSPDASELLAPWSGETPAVVVPDIAPVTEDDSIDLGIIDANPVSAAPGFSLIDVNAQAFIEYLIGRDTGVEMISLSNEFVLLDFDALLTGQTTHSMSWELADGNTISTVGLRSDFIEYDLIA